MKHYQLSQNVHIETFGDEAILFVADAEVMVNVNLAALELYEAFRSARNFHPFTKDECMDFLLETYDLSPDEAAVETISLISCGLRNRIVAKGGAVE